MIGLPQNARIWIAAGTTDMRCGGIVRLSQKSANRMGMKKAFVSVLRSTDASISFKDYRFLPDVISYAVWLYYRFPLSLRMVEELLAARG
ncbi:hypothetical protein WJ88_02235, partial [Burkholderia ubonensis]